MGVWIGFPKDDEIGGPAEKLIAPFCQFSGRVKGGIHRDKHGNWFDVLFALTSVFEDLEGFHEGVECERADVGAESASKVEQVVVAVEVCATEGLTFQCFKFPIATDGSMANATIDAVLFAAAHFAEPTTYEATLSFKFLLLQELVKLTLAPCVPSFQFVQHRTVQSVTPVHKDCREEKHLDVHKAALERCFFFMIFHVWCFLCFFGHFFISALLLQIGHLLSG